MTIFKNVIVTVAVAAIVSLLAATALFHSHTPAQNSLDPATELGASGGDVKTNVDTYANGIGLGKQGWATNYQQIQLTAGIQDIAWKNTTGRTVFVNYGQYTTSGTASSSVRFAAFATTSAAVPAGQSFATVVTDRPLLAPFTYATSTVATTTNSIKNAVSNGGMGVVPVLDGEYLHMYAQAVDSAGCPVTGRCESATSTNRGWGIGTLLFGYTYKP